MKLTGSRDALGQPALPLDKMQGFILRGYRMSFVRHFALTVNELEGARDFLVGLVNGRPHCPQITTAERWAVRPDYCLNIGFTYPGLQAMGVPQAYLDASFNNRDHLPFVNGSAASAGVVGDVADSAPGNWVIDDRDFHVMLSLYAQNEDALKIVSDWILKHCAPGFAVPGADRMFDSQALPDDKVFFGYTDNIAQPIVDKAQFPRYPDGNQTPVDPGAFVLGEATGAFAASFPVPTPSQFGRYGCFGAFRILKQDVEGFDAHIARIAPAFGEAFGITDPQVQRDAVMAKMCGRWPNGTPLSLYPVNGDTPAPALPFALRNDFQFTLPNGAPGNPSQNPDTGSNCPVSSHIRRGNMRNFPFAASAADKRRIMRRAMPYQNPYPAQPDRKSECGLMGFFLCACLTEQFEFVMQNWINNGTQQFSLAHDYADPLIGTNIAPPGAAFTETLPHARVKGQPPQPPTIIPMESFVSTRGSAYCYFPGMDGLRWIAAPIEQSRTRATR